MAKEHRWIWAGAVMALCALGSACSEKVTDPSTGETTVVTFPDDPTRAQRAEAFKRLEEAKQVNCDYLRNHPSGPAHRRGREIAVQNLERIRELKLELGARIGDCEC